MKKTTKDDYLQSIYKVIFYIEQNYSEDLTLEELSKVAGFSKYHFHRIFKSIVGENLSEYIRRVRLSSTTLKFKTNLNITQIAQISGYETNASFSKAFKNHFGITPKEFSKNAKKRKGDKMLKPKILNIDPIDVLYARKTGDYRTSADEAWNVIVDFAYANDLSGKVKFRYGIAHDNPAIVESDKIRYDACLEINDKSIKPNGKIQAKQLSGGKYAVFMHNGSYEQLDKTYKNIGDWIVDSGVELRDEPQFQKYLDLDPREVEVQDLQTEIYVPIK
ncbi:AraC family transcriptional regulator [Sulfurimonas lithotrophica]|uniref:AraC family transcriptional regulator n=1 Tax=Sulfurimonas lithotrophica TaxID=2590022 RepID=A0A5P8P1T4_9BACT|nr:AraC family transcriptional regulator [Sulfurimonas lithotrophica]QFR49634.1 AraC family transcriptional regulator [Sulfurimonas lithotrophica]